MGAVVFHLTRENPELYAKVAPVTDEDSPFDLSSEVDRLEWLAGRGIPVPRVVESGDDGITAWLVTEAVRGKSAAEEWPEHQRLAVVEAMADVTRARHELPVEERPFDRSLEVTVAQAARAVDEDLVDLDDLQDEHSGWSGKRLLEELRRTRPAREDLVVCHGDLCPNNVLLAPDTCRVTGVIDVARLGRADRHTDLAIATRELQYEEDPWFGARYAERFLQRYGIEGTLDKDRMAFFRLLDEFF